MGHPSINTTCAKNVLLKRKNDPPTHTHHNPGGYAVSTAAEDQHPLSSGQEVSRRGTGTWVSKAILEHKFKAYSLN